MWTAAGLLYIARPDSDGYDVAQIVPCLYAGGIVDELPSDAVRLVPAAATTDPHDGDTCAEAEKDREEMLDELNRVAMWLSRHGAPVTPRHEGRWRLVETIRSLMNLPVPAAVTTPPALVLAAEKACAAMGELDADATEGAPIWQLTDDEADVEVRKLLAARDALMDAINEAMPR
jgi:hypothetical protein